MQVNEHVVRTVTSYTMCQIVHVQKHQNQHVRTQYVQTRFCMEGRLAFLVSS